jgi:fatty-acyl-CoA synthase
VPEALPRETTVVSWDALDDAPMLDPSPPGLDDLAFIQYSSGSTGRPKGCMLTPRAIAAQLELIRSMMDGQPGRETVCSWLPLSHDMGLFGCLLYAWAWDNDLMLSTPDRFIASPRTWFSDMAQCGCTQSAGTSSALHLAARTQRSVRLPRELRLRSLVIGAERIEAQALDAVLATFQPAGLRPAALRPAYGLAEATLAVTATGIDVSPRTRSVDSVALADGLIQDPAAATGAATALVSLGRPGPGVELRFREPGRVSELHVRSPSLFDGYYGDPDQTSEHLQDAEFATRDLGFLHDGELFLVGRSDDVLSVGGRNVYTREIEAAVSAFDGVRRGCCAIVDVPDNGTSRLAMVLELRDGCEGFEQIALAAARTATAKAGIDLSECVFLEKGALPKTPTGKVQRFRCRELLLREGLSPVRRIWTGSARGPARGREAPKAAHV